MAKSYKHVAFDYLVMLVVGAVIGCHSSSAHEVEDVISNDLHQKISISLTSNSVRIAPMTPLRLVSNIKNISNETLNLPIFRHVSAIEYIDMTEQPTNNPHLLVRNKLSQSFKQGFVSLTNYELPPQGNFVRECDDLQLYYDMSLDGRYKLRSKLNKYADDIFSDELVLVVDSRLENLSTVFPLEMTGKWSKPQHGVLMSLTLSQEHYNEYGPVFLQIVTKNSSFDNLSTLVKTGNVFDVYDLTLETPGPNRDFRKLKEKKDARSAILTLYGQKLFSEKSKELKTSVIVKPGEEFAKTVIVLNRLFDMSEDGIYGLTVSRKIIGADGKEQTIASDPLPIRIGTTLTQDEIDQRIKERNEQEKKNKSQ